MKSTVINTSKEMTAYSDFVPPAEAANYMHNSEMLSYFRSYAEHFHLLRHIKFEHEVVRVARNDRFNETGQWDIIVRDLKCVTLQFVPTFVFFFVFYKSI